MHMADKKTIGERIQFTRLSAGLSRLEFGRKLKYSVAAVRNWEIGYSLPYPQTLAKIAKIGHTSVKQLINPDDRGVLLLDKDTALSLHASLYIILSNHQFTLSNPEDTKRIKWVDDKAKEVIERD